jgi:PhnB protein
MGLSEGVNMPAPATSKDYHTITPYLIVRSVPGLMEFLTKAFGATERCRLPRPDGSIMHAEAAIGDSIIMMGEPTGNAGPMPASFYLRVSDADAAYRKALAAGATSLSEPTDQPHAGERYGGVIDPFGNRWWPAAPIPALTR